MNGRVKMQANKFGVIGHPIEHSLSPLMHNAALRELGLDYEYRAFDVKKEELETRIREFKKKGFIGLNVTIPHKVAVLKHMDSLSEDAALVGAVNTIKFGRKNIGYNTDGIGCTRALDDAGVKVRGKRILILGAGGAARAIAFKLAMENAAITLADIIMEKAVTLAEDIKSKLGRRVDTTGLEGEILKKKIKEIDVLINATPAGMWPNVDETPINPEVIREGMAVMDIVYNPVETKLLREARKNGCKTINGVGMFVHQGAESLKIWLGIEPPIDVMRKAVVKELQKGG